MPHCTGTEIGDFPKSGFENFKGGTLKKYRPKLGTVSNTFPELNHCVKPTVS